MSCIYKYKGKDYTKEEFYSLVRTTMVQPRTVQKYEKVLFPKGETAAKIEGHETIADNIRRIDNEIESTKKTLAKPKEKRAVDLSDEYLQERINKFEQEKADLKEQGIEKLKPIEAFYEIKVGNILEKQFGKDNVKTITDEYGNEWREITIDKERDLNNIYLAEVIDNNFDKEVGNSSQNNFILKGTVLDFIKSSDKQSREGIRNLINSNRIKFHCK